MVSSESGHSAFMASMTCSIVVFSDFFSLIVYKMRPIRIKTGSPRLSFCPALAFPRPGFSLCSTRHLAFIGRGSKSCPLASALSELSGVFKRCGRSKSPSRIVPPSFDFCQTDQTLSGFSRLSGSTGASPSPPLCRTGYFLPAARRCWRLRCSSACFIISSILRCHLEGPRVLAF